MRFFQPISTSDGPADGRLQEAVRAARGSRREPRLSDAARGRILRESTRAAAKDPLPSLFVPARRLLAAGFVPLAMTAALLVAVRGPAVPTAPAPVPTRLQVSKQDGEVIFRIANGKTVHDVYRSTAPDRFDSKSRVRVTDGSFRDALADRQNVVFYRID